MLNAEQVKEQLRRRGVTMATWARVNGHKAQDVYDVLSGRTHGECGESHVIAVKLGLKAGVIVALDDLKKPLTAAVA